mgnify:CR=1 FL=1
MPLVAEGITQLHSIAFENLLPAKRLGDPDRSDRRLIDAVLWILKICGNAEASTAPSHKGSGDPLVGGV